MPTVVPRFLSFLNLKNSTGNTLLMKDWGGSEIDERRRESEEMLKKKKEKSPKKGVALKKFGSIFFLPFFGKRNFFTSLLF